MRRRTILHAGLGAGVLGTLGAALVIDKNGRRQVTGGLATV